MTQTVSIQPPRRNMRVRSLTPATLKPPVRRPECGTYRGYFLHYDNGEERCQDCKTAATQYGADRRNSQPAEVQAAKRARKNADKAALARLAQADPSTYRRLLSQERHRLTLALLAERGERAEITRTDQVRLYQKARYHTLVRMAEQDPDHYHRAFAEELAERGLTA